MKRNFLKQLPILCFAIIATIYIQLTITEIFFVILFLFLLGILFGNIFYDIPFDEDSYLGAKLICLSFIIITVYTMLQLSSWFFLAISLFESAMGFLFSITDTFLEYYEDFDYDNQEEKNDNEGNNDKKDD